MLKPQMYLRHEYTPIRHFNSKFSSTDCNYFQYKKPDSKNLMIYDSSVFVIENCSP